MVYELNRRYENNTMKGKNLKAQRILLKSWEILQEKVGIIGKLANNETLEIEHTRVQRLLPIHIV